MHVLLFIYGLKVKKKNYVKCYVGVCVKAFMRINCFGDITLRILIDIHENVFIFFGWFIRCICRLNNRK